MVGLPAFCVAAVLLCTGCGGFAGVTCLDLLILSVVAEVRTADGSPAAAGARLIVFAEAIVDTGWGAPLESALYLSGGEHAVPRVDVRVEKPWYQSVDIRSVQVAVDDCGVREPTQVEVLLTLLPGAPPVRSVYLGHGGYGFSGRIAHQLSVVVDVAPGVSKEVAWMSTDTSVVVVDTAGRIRSRCRTVAGEAFVVAHSLVDPAVRDSVGVSVLPGTTGCT